MRYTTLSTIRKGRKGRSLGGHLDRPAVLLPLRLTQEGDRGRDEEAINDGGPRLNHHYQDVALGMSTLDNPAGFDASHLLNPDIHQDRDG